MTNRTGKIMAAVLAAGLSFAASAATLYVDCDAATGGDGSESSPFNSLADALSASAARDTLAVRGAIEVADPSQRIIIPAEKEGIHIVPWGDGRLAIAAGPTYAASAGANGTAILLIGAANATVSGIDVTYAKNSLYDKTSKTMARLVTIGATNITLVGCTVRNLAADTDTSSYRIDIGV